MSKNYLTIFNIISKTCANLITELHKIHFFDVCENYFNAYLDRMDDFFKGKDKTISTFEESRPESVYKEPYYTEEQNKLISEQARRAFLHSNNDLAKVRKILQTFKRRIQAVRNKNTWKYMSKIP